MVDRTSEARIVVVTGVSRRAGIGFAIVRRLLRDGARVLIHSFSPHDAEQSWGADPGGMDALIGELGGASDRLQHIEADLGDPSSPRRVIEAAVDAFGAVDALVVNHAHGFNQSLETVTVEELADELADRGITVNAINPGPVDTGWPSAELRERLRPAFPAGRWGRPEDIAAIVGWLVSPDSGWMTGQAIDAEGGFRRQSVSQSG
jgi:NAD(P)-dependent dehydrogenase (short-subunit alcohol dehydrogenase family)